MFCSNCGTGLGEGINFCSNCGRSVNEKPANGAPSTVSSDNMRYRHGFTSFWLWASIIVHILVLFFVLAGAFSEVLLSAFSRTVSLLSSILGIIAHCLLIFGWKKSGFYLVIVVGVALVFVDPYGQGIGMLIIGTAAQIGILFAVLKIRNNHNGKSTWEQLSGGHHIT